MYSKNVFRKYQTPTNGTRNTDETYYLCKKPGVNLNATDVAELVTSDHIILIMRRSDAVATNSLETWSALAQVTIARKGGLEFRGCVTV